MTQKLRILWLKTGPLHPLDTGGKLRTYHMLRELSRQHDLTFLSLCPPDTEPEIKRAASEYSNRQVWIPWQSASKGSPAFFLELVANLFSSLPYAIQKYRSPEMSRSIREEVAAGGYHLVVCDFLTPAVNLFGGMADAVQSPTLLFQHNVESLIWERLTQTAANPVKQWYFQMQWRRMRAFEQAITRRCTGVVAVSDEDCALMRQAFGLTNVLGSVPTGVDIEYFAAVQRAPVPGEIMFLGSMDWMPNIDAVKWFAEAMWPQIRAGLPNARFIIVGRKPVGAVQELAKRDPSIEVTGTVEDTRPYLSRAALMVVPLRVGGGTRIKIYEAMAAGVPVVSTRVGAEGLAVKDGENILLADDPDTFARHVVTLASQPELGERMGRAGQNLVRQHFGWAAATEVFSGYCRQVILSKNAPSTHRAV